MDPAADLAVVTAVASALLDKIVAYDTVVLGEVGLSSEVRSVSQVAVRINEAEKLGFKKCILPRKNLNVRGGLKGVGRSPTELRSSKLELIPVETVKEALDHL